VVSCSPRVAAAAPGQTERRQDGCASAGGGVHHLISNGSGPPVKSAPAGPCRRSTIRSSTYHFAPKTDRRSLTFAVEHRSLLQRSHRQHGNGHGDKARARRGPPRDRAWRAGVVGRCQAERLGACSNPVVQVQAQEATPHVEQGHVPDEKRPPRCGRRQGGEYNTKRHPARQVSRWKTRTRPGSPRSSAMVRAA